MPPSRRRSVLTEKNLNSVQQRSSPRNQKKVAEKPADTEATSDYGSATSSRAVTPDKMSPPKHADSTHILNQCKQAEIDSQAKAAKLAEGVVAAEDQVVPSANKEKTDEEPENKTENKIGIEFKDPGLKSTTQDDEVPSLPQDRAPLLRRAVKDDSKDEYSEDQIKDDDKEDTIEGEGLLSAEAIKEEEAAHQKNLIKHEKEAKNKTDELPPAVAEMSKQERYEMLVNLLQKSEFFVTYLKNKMSDDADTDKKRKEAREAKVQKELKKGRKAGTKDDREVPENTGRGKRKRKSDIPEQEENVSKKVKTEYARFHDGQPISNRQPLLLSGGLMRTYQLEGFEWLAKLYENGINGILADEMGLGKTIQTIAMLCFLYEVKVPGPFIVIAPLSTVPNWCNEFKRFAPTIPCILYHGSPDERAEKRRLIGKSHYNEVIDENIFSVIVTSYEIAMNDRAFLAPIRWKYLAVDEGHRLKNMECRLIKELKKYDSANRLLLTGTPLQNNLRELFSLLNFILPEIFDNVQVFESWFDAKEIQEDEENTSEKIILQEQKNSVVNMLHKILLPFLRRRIKTDVGLEIPPKKEVLVYCPMTQMQKELYQAVVERSIEEFLSVKKDEVIDVEQHGRGKRTRESIDYNIFDNETELKDDDKFEASLAKWAPKVAAPSYSAYNLIDKMGLQSETRYSIKSRMMDMRKAVNHPYLIDYPITDDGFYKIDEEVVGMCGKTKVLDQMLTELIRKGHKILLFSQMTRMLDILGDYLNMRKIKFSRLDGSMNFIDRQANIDMFNRNAEVNVFLLSTRAGGLGINLTAADTVIIYDSDWNPQQDLQAQDRCHRIGQTRPVMVYRLVTKGTFDEKIVLRAAAKRKIEKLVIHKDKFNSVTADTEDKASLKIDPQELLKLLHSKDHVGAITCSEGEVLAKEDLAKLLDRSDLTWGEADAKPKTDKENKTENEIPGVFQVIHDESGENSVLNSLPQEI